MPTPTNYSSFFSAIHKTILQIIKKGEYRWTQAGYIENIFSWHSEFSNDLKNIKKSTSFADKAELGYIGKTYIYTVKEFEEKHNQQMDVPKMLSVCLKAFFKEKGLRRFDSFRDCYVVSFSDDSQKYSLVTSGHYPDPDFYGTAEEVIGRLREILPATGAFDLLQIEVDIQRREADRNR